MYFVRNLYGFGRSVVDGDEPSERTVRLDGDRPSTPLSAEKNIHTVV